MEDLARSGGAALPEEFRPVVAVARASEAARRALAPVSGPHLTAHREALPRFEALLARAGRIFASDGTLSDDASPELAAARRRLRRRRGDVSRSLEKMLETRREVFGDVVVLRNDRYCLPVLASARAKVAGILHDRSGSGQTVFIEPLKVVEANNELALLASEERREAERILIAFGREVLGLRGELESAVARLSDLDALEAKVEFGELAEGRVPELSDDGSWRLAGARHPLLDRRLADLRRRVLGESRGERDAVTLDLELPPRRRLLVLSGPNAGGKTVVLKTAALFSLLAQSGVPLPAAAGTRLPFFAALRAEIGDAQEILSDRSTFSSAMETLASILGEASSGMLAVIDEIAAATDPEEGSALAIAFLEEYLSRGGRAIVTTHLSAIKTFAAGREDAVLAGMEFDEATGRSTYRLRPGLAGKSRALAAAREHGIPERVLARAHEILGEAWIRRDRLEEEAQAALERLRREQEAAEKLVEETRREREALEHERQRLERERERFLREGLASFDRARQGLSRRVESELASLRAQGPKGGKESAAALIAEAEREAVWEEAVVEARAAAENRARALRPGDRVRLRGLQTSGSIAALEEEWAWLDVDGKRLRVVRTDLEPAQGGQPPRPRPPQGSARASAAAEPSSDLPGGLSREVNVIGRRLEEAIDAVEKALDAALASGAARVRVVHGHGTGRLRAGLREHLRGHPAVASLRAGEPREGGNGATIVELG